ncbi:hypothetical protein Acr_17g0011680 [Actinidia rufa]|uniref:Uncharacterized protein n=1 Tax=Actinidia rufa TaxID=165716 RepID=A0A7J0G468_9ERIC|nr:hypothetical protein Acr_17g0011680 [Actinidia rufa]
MPTQHARERLGANYSHGLTSTVFKCALCLVWLYYVTLWNRVSLINHWPVYSPNRHSLSNQEIIPLRTRCRRFRFRRSRSRAGSTSRRSSSAGVKDACGRNLDRSRCCPVLAAWLYAAHARSALQVPAAAEPVVRGHADDARRFAEVRELAAELADEPQHPHSAAERVVRRRALLLRDPAPPDHVPQLRNRLQRLRISECDADRRLEKSRAELPELVDHFSSPPIQRIRIPIYGSWVWLKGEGKNGSTEGSDRASKMFGRDCQLMGLTWLLARNKTAYIPTVSAVLRAIMYSAHPPHESTCSPDQENMPLAVDSLQFEKADSSSFGPSPVATFWFPFFPLMILVWLLLGV